MSKGHPVRRATGITGASLLVLVLLVAVKLEVLRIWLTWCATWGSTSSEPDDVLPGDDLLEHTDLTTTRAITIDASPAQVWPWLVQLGPDRGGVYTYDWIENVLGLNVKSVDEIIPEFQQLEIGDAQQLGSRGASLRVTVLEPERTLVLKSDDGHWVWGFHLRPEGSATRLISRNRIDLSGMSRKTRAAYRYAMTPGSLVMERKMLLGIKERAERLVSTSGVGSVAKVN